jgi:endonuclease YncB( thermonuclease family)
VEIDQKDRDQYGRVVGLVYIEGDGECLNEELVRAGHAWVYERYCHTSDCDHWQRLERRARQAEKGIVGWR